ncbi:MAG: YncE family protein [Bacteroides sp.]|nr:YncE family protein [Bacteroides sp.]MCM1378672.1 YncE family protein [Bacteroides sp.]MCM1444945.1 YncE family protein [Prevotella sp.]
MKKTHTKILFLYVLSLLMVATSCREDELVVPTEYDIIPETAEPTSQIRGFYLVNEGNMGSNKCTLDYFDYLTGLYARNFYAERNPNVIKELGDVGNDIGIYGSKLYVVVNCSHKVEVMDARNGVRIGQVDIPNCRYIKFYRGKAYVSSYVGPVLIDPDTPKGAVFEVDTLSLDVTRKVSVGYQPEEMEIVDDYMYVANSGGYRAPFYDNTVSVIQMIDFKQVQQIPVAINLHRVKKDQYGKLWVSSRGDYQTRPSRLCVLDKKPGYNTMVVTDTLPIACSNMAIRGDSLYYYTTEWNNYTQANTISYGIINVKTKQIVSTNFISDGTEKDITIPYGIALHPETGDIFVTDAKNYVSSGTLYCFSPDGKRKWSVRTGDIPAHIAFLKR